MAVDREGGPQGLYKSFDLQRTIQEQALRTKYIKIHSDKTSESPLCKMY